MNDLNKMTAQERKATPIFSGVLKYFPDAIAAVAHCSQVGNDQHHPGQPLHWDRTKSTDELDALVRHLLGAGTIDSDGIRHSAKVAWRALANLQKEIEALANEERIKELDDIADRLGEIVDRHHVPEQQYMERLRKRYGDLDGGC
jgi:hypothetical protein